MHMAKLLQYICLAHLRKAEDRQLRDPPEHHFMLKKTHFWALVGPGRASPHATCKALNRYSLMVTIQGDAETGLGTVPATPFLHK